MSEQEIQQDSYRYLWDDMNDLQTASSEGRERLYLYSCLLQIIFPFIVYVLAYILLDYILQFIGANMVLPSALVGGLCMFGACLSILGAFTKKELSVKWDMRLPLTVMLSLFLTILFNVVILSLPLKNISQSYQQAENVLYGVPFAIQLFLYGVVSPFTEELVFRGAIFRRLRKILPWLPSAIISALAFGVYHGNIVQGIYGFLMGMFMAYVYEQTRSFWAPVLFHSTANILSCIVTNKPDMFGKVFSLVPAMVAGVLSIAVVLVFIFIARNKKKNNCSI